MPPQTVAERDLDRAAALVERAAAESVPFVVELAGAATFLPDSPVAYLAVREGGLPCTTWRSPSRSRRWTGAPIRSTRT